MNVKPHNNSYSSNDNTGPLRITEDPSYVKPDPLDTSRMSARQKRHWMAAYNANSKTTDTTPSKLPEQPSEDTYICFSEKTPDYKFINPDDTFISDSQKTTEAKPSNNEETKSLSDPLKKFFAPIIKQPPLNDTNKIS